eukprot:CAMPEP_0174229162 /NCGR_PEP_ID=MMETSP0417-20130205/206_1 /TAXON_ID=242541 /ORGANISM="Mayorella sp, Strain BSH-02190019" /LENGTH=2373 /DNA_ID=CAMNT_0015306685 /DNA_START=405 /DNA_END=7526 /DNA_ORIENTATION=-
MRAAVVFTLLVVCALALGASAQSATTFDSEVRPVITEYDDWAHVSTRDWVQVKGCGFMTYSHVVCLWDYRWSSFASYIVSDDLIVCQVPELAKEEFKSLPYWTRLDLVFDGNLYEQDMYAEVTTGPYELRAGPFRFGPALDCAAPLQPNFGRIGGGTTVQITGEGFQDNWESVSVYFDNALAPSASVSSDTVLSVTTPAGEFDQNAMVTVVFNQDQNCYLHSKDTFHYGPIPQKILPPCTYEYGGTPLFIEGELMDDFTPGLANTPGAVFVEVAQAGNLGSTDKFDFIGVQASLVSSLEDSGKMAIRFVAPTPDSFAFSTSATWHAVNPIVRVHWRQVDADSLTLSQTYKYGAVVFGDDDPNPWNSGADGTNPLITSTRDAGSCSHNEDLDWPEIPGGHLRGDDQVCVRGCGFHNFTNADDISMQLDSAEWCQATTKAISFAGSGSVSRPTEELFCCTSSPYSDCELNKASPLSVELEFNALQGTETEPPTALGVVLGPQVDLDQYTRGPVDGGDSYVVTGRFFRSSGSSAVPDDWTTLVAEFPDADVVSDPPFTVTSDCTAQLVVPEAVCGLNSYFLMDFDDASSCSNLPAPNELKHKWGPECSLVLSAEEQALDLKVGPLSGNAQFSVSGAGFLESGMLASQLEMGMCLTRLNPSMAEPCEVAEDVSSSLSGISNTGATATTLTLWEDVVTAEGGQRLWGDHAQVYMFFPENRTSLPTIHFDGTLVSDERVCYTDCGTYRFGPVITGLDQCKGPTGPDNLAESITTVQLSGIETGDTWYPNPSSGSFDQTLNPNQVTFGIVFGTVPTTAAASLTTATMWGGVANSDVSVTAWFDTCNVTAEWQERDIMWGPRVDSVHTTGIPRMDPLVKGTEDLFGFKPWDTAVVLTVTGRGFEAYCSDKWSGSAPCTGMGYDSYARCIIDGVKSDATILPNGNEFEVLCNTVRRPFGSRAAVSVEFGRPCAQRAGATDEPGVDLRYSFQSALIKMTPESGWTREGVDWSRVLTASNAIWYRPYLHEVTPSAGLTSGGEDITISGEGMAGWDVAGDGVLSPTDYSVWVGQYEAGLGAVNDLSVVATTPTYSAEFNTIVSVSFEMPARNETSEEYPEKYHGECAQDVHDWRVTLDSAYRYGPTCNGVDQPYGSMGGFESSTDDHFTLVGSDFRDCDECATECGTTLWNSPTTVPYAPNQVEAEDRGSTKCIHRKVQYLRYTYNYYGTIGDSSWQTEGPYDPISNDTYFINTANAIAFESVRTANNRPCPLKVVYALYFPDALVSTEAQRTIPCYVDDTDAQIFGPTWNGFVDSDWYNSLPNSDYSKTSYGWYGDEVSHSFINLGDPYVDCPDCINTVAGPATEANFLFHTGAVGASGVSGTESTLHINSGGTAYTVGAFSGDYSTGGTATTVFVDAPVISNAWNQYRRMRLVFNQRANNGSDCAVDASLFHYGPVLTSVATEEVCFPLHMDETSAETIVISGRAFGCCGFTTSVTAPGDSPFSQEATLPACVMPGHYNGAFAYDNNTLTVSDAPGSGLSSASCVVPFNNRLSLNSNNDVNQAIWGFGLRWNNTGSSSDTRLLTRAEDGSLFTKCYGPRQDDATTTLRYSGMPSGSSPNFPPHDVNSRAFVTITGQNLDENDGSFESEPMCEWLNVNNGNNVLIGTVGGSASGWECPVHRVFWKRCQDPADFVALAFNSTKTGGDQADYREFEVVFPTDEGTGQPSPRWIAQGSTRVSHTVEYGPLITDVQQETPSLTNMPQTSNIAADVDRFYTWEEGGLNLDLTLVNFEDWLTDDAFGSMGTQELLPLFGNKRHGPHGTGTNQAPNYVNAPFVAYSNEDFNGATVAVAGSVSVRVPPNGFGTVQRLSVLFDPHADLYTTLFSPSEEERFPANSRQTEYWHWTPYANAVSRSWVSTRGHEELVVSGGGFCAYSAVACIFDGKQSEGDIVGDNKVVCRTAPNDVSTASVQLRFCNTYDNARCDCGYGCDESPDDVLVWDEVPSSPLNLQYYGVSAETVPMEGPHYGDTVVEFPYIGLENFDRITCQWGSVSSSADAQFAGQSGNGTSNSGALTCVTPSVGGVQVDNILMHLYWTTGGNISYSPYDNSPIWETVMAPNSFDFGEPTITAISPAETDIDMSGVQTVVVSGRYFNGGDAFGVGNKTVPRQNEGSYSCHWFTSHRDPVVTLPAVAKEPADFNGIASYNLVCPTPELTDSSEIGDYQLEIQWAAASGPTTDYFQFSFTQNPLISNVTADSENDDDNLINELGSIVTLVGNNFNNGMADRYFSRWESLTGEDPIIQVSCEYLDSEHVRCPAPPRNMTLQLAMRRDVNVQISLNGGETYSAAFTTTYEGDPEAVFCLDGAAALSVSALVAVLVALFAMLF